MTSRFYLAVAMIGLVAGASWGAYELSKRAPVAPADTTLTRAPQGEAGAGAADAPAHGAESPAAVTILGAGESGEAAAVAKPAPGDGEAEEATSPPNDGSADRAAVAAMPEQADPASGRDGRGTTVSTVPESADLPAPPPSGLAPAPSATRDPATPEQAGTGETAPRPAGVTETIRRALSELLGGTADEPAREPSPEGQIAATPPTPAVESTPPVETAEGDLAEIAPEAAPSFDIVRISPDGAAVIAGRATPGAEVELRSGEQVIDRVHADRRGPCPGAIRS